MSAKYFCDGCGQPINFGQKTTISVKGISSDLREHNFDMCKTCETQVFSYFVNPVFMPYIIGCDAKTYWLEDLVLASSGSDEDILGVAKEIINKYKEKFVKK